MKNNSPFLKLIDPFKALLLDAYGVFWAGGEMGVFPGAKEVMQEAVSSGKIVGILTNSSQLAAREKEKLFRHGINEGTHYHFLVSSGEVARELFLKGDLPFSLSKKRYWLCGGTNPKYLSHQGIFLESGLSETTEIKEADFIYVSVPHINGEDQIDPELFRHLVDKIDPLLPMVCVNPDHFAHEGKPPRLVVRQGAIASMYSERGGEVVYMGKPYPMAYSFAMREFERFGIRQAKEVLMVGDTPETDIRGANGAGMASLLLTETGIMADRIRKKGREKAFLDLLSSDISTLTAERFC